MSDPFDLLRTHVQHQAATVEPLTSVDELIAHIVLEHERMPSTSSAQAGVPWPGSVVRPPRRRWGSAVVGMALVVGIGTGAVVTAAVLERKPVAHVDHSVLCHPSVDGPVLGLVTDIGADPLQTCADNWAAGNIQGVSAQAQADVPPMVACIGHGGGLEVFPGEGDGACAALGMQSADVDAVLADPVQQLSRRTSEINAQCLSGPEAGQAVQALFDELDLGGWSVVLLGGDRPCGIISDIDGVSRVVSVTQISPP